MLGNERAKYMRPKVGIILHAGMDDYRKEISQMQMMSGNVELAMHPLGQIVDTMIEVLESYNENSKRFDEPVAAMKEAKRQIELADAALLKRQRGE